MILRVFGILFWLVLAIVIPPLSHHSAVIENAGNSIATVIAVLLNTTLTCIVIGIAIALIYFKGASRLVAALMLPCVIWVFTIFVTADIVPKLWYPVVYIRNPGVRNVFIDTNGNAHFQVAWSVSRVTHYIGGTWGDQLVVFDPIYFTLPAGGSIIERSSANSASAIDIWRNAQLIVRRDADRETRIIRTSVLGGRRYLEICVQHTRSDSTFNDSVSPLSLRDGDTTIFLPCAPVVLRNAARSAVAIQAAFSRNERYLALLSATDSQWLVINIDSATTHYSGIPATYTTVDVYPDYFVFRPANGIDASEILYNQSTAAIDTSLPISRVIYSESHRRIEAAKRIIDAWREEYSDWYLISGGKVKAQWLDANSITDQIQMSGT